MSVEHRADDELYREAETLFGTNALMDIAVLVGTYHMACATLTPFAMTGTRLDGARGLGRRAAVMGAAYMLARRCLREYYWHYRQSR